MTLSHFTPEAIRPPFARYSHGVAVEPGSRLLFCSGQLGIRPDDGVPDAAGAHAELCFDNIRAILREANMTPLNVVRVNTYVTDRVYLDDYMLARDKFFADVEPPPASTLMVVSVFAREILKIEIEVLAAGPEGDYST